ncbi:AAA family ATPase [Patescibacteria group bacterium]|nr:AAA family ATPase [Candidatus Falkowbacteria bacterium]MBU3906439.1 AAA family ATPase [Patescibacteria group bacterium]MBU4015494.1 AAA family ATPase [Patescibacteria group bacterium]MBU4026401.1 AAA family ATPase [Patescibacteria group bacterium]MBU4073741.1 AAA family ATPase [Patescibacteria group bacterium]
MKRFVDLWELDMQNNNLQGGTKKIIAVIGMCGAGKSEVVNYLQKKLKCPKIYFGDATFDRMKKDELELNYENERAVREKIRSELGMGAYAKLALPKIKKALKNNGIALIESLYSWDEYKIMKQKFSDSFKLIAVYASPNVRFQRLKKRKKERPIKNYKEFKTRDYSEIEGTDKGGPIAIADYTIINEGSIKNLHKNINDIINKI